LEYRCYRGGDEQDLVDCWNASFARDPITLARFVETTLLDDNFCEAGLIEAYDGSHLAGFVHATTIRGSEGGDGWICALGVEPDSRRRGIARRLLGLAEAYLATRRATRIVVSGYPPSYYYPGVPRDRYDGSSELFESAGYRCAAEVVAMDRRLVDYETPGEIVAHRTALESAGYRFHAIAPAWYVRFVRAAEAFSADWGAAARRSLRRPGDAAQIQLATREGEVEGFAIFGAYDNHAERFGPFGVRRSVRGGGVGAVLLHGTLREMAAAGLHGCWFLWTGEDEPAGRLYLRAGFEVTRRFGVYVRNLEAESC